MEFTTEIINISKINEGFFIGDQFAGTNPYLLLQFKISHVINTSGCQVMNQYESMGIKYLTLNWKEMPSQSLFDKNDEIVNQIVSFIDRAMMNGDGLIAFSVKGQNRACVAVVIYLMKKYSWSLKKSIEFLKSRKKDVNIQKYFLNQLGNFEKRLTTKYGQIISTNWNLETCKSDEEIILRNTFVNGINNRKILNDSNHNKKKNCKNVGFADVIRTVGNPQKDLLFLRDIKPIVAHMKMRPSKSCVKNRGSIKYDILENKENNDTDLIKDKSHHHNKGENYNNINKEENKKENHKNDEILKSKEINNNNNNKHSNSSEKGIVNNFINNNHNNNGNNLNNLEGLREVHNKEQINEQNNFPRTINNNINNIIPIKIIKENDDLNNKNNISNKNNNFAKDESKSQIPSQIANEKNEQNEGICKNNRKPHRPTSNYGQRANMVNNGENNFTKHEYINANNAGVNINNNNNNDNNSININNNINNQNKILVTNNIGQIVNNNINNFFVPQELFFNQMNSNFEANNPHINMTNNPNIIKNDMNMAINNNHNKMHNNMNTHNNFDNLSFKDNKLLRSSSASQQNRQTQFMNDNKLLCSENNQHFMRTNNQFFHHNNLNENINIPNNIGLNNKNNGRSFSQMRKTSINLDKKYKMYEHSNIRMGNAKGHNNNNNNFIPPKIQNPFIHQNIAINNFNPALLNKQQNQNSLFNKPINHMPRSQRKNSKDFIVKKPSTPDPIKMVYFQNQRMNNINNNINNFNTNSTRYNQKVSSNNNNLGKRFFLLNKNDNIADNLKRPSTAPHKEKNNSVNPNIHYFNSPYGNNNMAPNSLMRNNESNNSSNMVSGYLKRLPSPNVQINRVNSVNSSVNKQHKLHKKKYKLSGPIGNIGETPIIKRDNDISKK